MDEKKLLGHDSIASFMYEKYSGYAESLSYSNMMFAECKDGSIHQERNACFGWFHGFIRKAYTNWGGLERLTFTFRTISIPNLIDYDALIEDIREFCKDIFDIEVSKYRNFISLSFNQKFKGNPQLLLALFTSLLSMIRYADKEQQSSITDLSCKQFEKLPLTTLKEVVPLALSVRGNHAHNINSRVVELYKKEGKKITDRYIDELQKVFVLDFVNNPDVLKYFSKFHWLESTTFPGQSHLAHALLYAKRSLGWE